VKRANKDAADSPFVQTAMQAARSRLRDLIVQERQRARTHIELIRRGEPSASRDRIARVILDRWKKVASFEGGLTGTLGFAGIPLNSLLFAYFQVAVIVSIAESYDTPLEGDQGEELLLSVLGRAHGVEDVLRSTPRVLGALAKSIAVRHGLAGLGRLVPLVAAPIAARLNEQAMERTGEEALQRFGNIVFG
jgi:hypothetical protein